MKKEPDATLRFHMLNKKVKRNKPAIPKKDRQQKKKKYAENDNRQESTVWVNPNSTFKGPRGHHSWERLGVSPPSAGRLLELADIALGFIKPSAWPAKNRKVSA